MKATWSNLRAAALAPILWAVVASPMAAQIIELRGSVTQADGGFAGLYSPGAAVVAQLDLASPLVDLVPDDPRLGLYSARSITFRAGGDWLPVDRWPHEVAILSGWGGTSGLMVGAWWPALAAPRVLVFALLGETDLIDSDTTFPAGVPMEHFTSHEGEYLSSAGRIRWSIEAYEVGASPAMAVPEPAAYGWSAAAVLLSVAAWRGRRRRGRR